MQLEKIVTDWYTMYSQPETLSVMKNCIIYISEYNLEMLKRKINECLNDKNKHTIVRELELKQYTPIIEFIRKNFKELEEKVVQTEELTFVKENNSYIVVVKDTKDVHTINENTNKMNIARADNETIFIGLFEEAQIITVRDSITKIINEAKIPVFCINIKDKSN